MSDVSNLKRSYEDLVRLSDNYSFCMSQELSRKEHFKGVSEVVSNNDESKEIQVSVPNAFVSSDESSMNLIL